MVCIHFMMALVSGATCRGWSTAFKILPSLLAARQLPFLSTPDPTELLSSYYRVVVTLVTAEHMLAFQPGAHFAPPGMVISPRS